MPAERQAPCQLGTRSMPLIFINRYFHPDQSATSQILSDLAFALAEDGHQVRVITGRQLYEEPQHRLTPNETVRGVEVHRVWTSRFGRGSLLGRTLDYLTFWASGGLKLWHLTRAHDVVVAKTDPPLLSVIAAPIARRRGARLINWLQDIYPETAQMLGLGRGRLARAVYSGLRALRDRSLKSSAMNVVPGERMAEFLARRGVPPEQVRIIPNFADGVRIKPSPQARQPSSDDLRAAWGLDDMFVVGYSGNLGRAHDYATLLDAIERIGAQQRAGNDDAERIAFLFIGGGALYDNLKSDIGKCRLPSVRFEPYQPRERLSESLSVPDVHIVSLLPELESLIVPSKIYGITAVARPTIFIGDPDGEIARLIARHRCGRTVPAGDGGALTEAIRELAAAPSLCDEMGARARRAFEAAFDKRIAVVQWDALLTEMSDASSDVGQADSAAPVSARNAL